MKFETKEELIENLINYKFLTSDSFSWPDRTYIYLDSSYENPIRFMRADGATESFDFTICKHCDFREVDRKYNIFNY